MNLTCFCFRTLDLGVCILLTGEDREGCTDGSVVKGIGPWITGWSRRRTRLSGHLSGWNDFQNTVNRVVYSFWRVYCSKTVRMRNKTKDRYCFMRSRFSEMVSPSKELMLISSKVCEALTPEVICLYIQLKNFINWAVPCPLISLHLKFCNICL